MLKSDGKRICDAEVGHYTGGWHMCRRKPVLSVWKQGRDYGIELDYCAIHTARAGYHQPNTTLRIVSRTWLNQGGITLIGEDI